MNTIIYMSFFPLVIASLIAVSARSTQIGDTLAVPPMTSVAYLYPGDVLRSKSNRYIFTLQNDGNLVLYYNPGFQQQPIAVWASNTAGKKNVSALFQYDGQFSIREKHENISQKTTWWIEVWKAESTPISGIARSASLSVLDTGDVVITVKNSSGEEFVTWKPARARHSMERFNPDVPQ